MGSYVSIPFVSRKVVHIEQGKPAVPSVKGEALVHHDTANQVEKMPLTPIHEDKEEIKEDVKDIEIIKDDVEDKAVKTVESVVSDQTDSVARTVEKATYVVEEVLKDAESAFNAMKDSPAISNLTITIPADESETSNSVERIPEFKDNVSAPSTAIKKFNRRHRKHQH
jgi:hypothetical protein